MLPAAVAERCANHLARVKRRHERTWRRLREVELPFALEKSIRGRRATGPGSTFSLDEALRRSTLWSDPAPSRVRFGAPAGNFGGRALPLHCQARRTATRYVTPSRRICCRGATTSGRFRSYLSSGRKHDHGVHARAHKGGHGVASPLDRLEQRRAEYRAAVAQPAISM